jgi:hypothetical protein
MTAGRTRVLIPKSNVSLKNCQANENQNHQKFAAKISTFTSTKITTGVILERKGVREKEKREREGLWTFIPHS